MRWLSHDINMFVQAKEYVDTAILPLVPLDFSGSIKNIVQTGESTMTVATALEREYQGRVFLIPTFHYWVEQDMNLTIKDLQSWIEKLKKAGFEKVFLLSCDNEWRLVEKELELPLLWLPSFSLDHIDDKHKKSYIDNQLAQLSPYLMRAWN
ncbi:DUF2487 family protein [Bacillus sp. HMF5848]|uniref:DUF2487 family protein n=1 Tax=Bacillus sp. HMF5848 TaxID=2495421 RepID=UPI000F7AB658|nr:DUF2487 family protein [Bacillus sp. HMF5848]RSK27418.1 DUF2487 family protein [Bacillus sp. HMF5848]